MRREAAGAIIERRSHLVVEQATPGREVERQQAQLLRGGLKQGQAGVIVVHDAAQAAGDSLEELAQIEGGNDGIVDVEQHAQAIAVARELLLIVLGPLEIEGVVHGHGDLAGHLLQEVDFGWVVVVGLNFAEAQGAEAALRGGERDQAKGADILGAQHFHDAGEGSLGGDVVDDQRLLGFEDPAGGGFFDGRFRRRAGCWWAAGFRECAGA